MKYPLLGAEPIVFPDCFGGRRWIVIRWGRSIGPMHHVIEGAQNVHLFCKIPLM